MTEAELREQLTHTLHVRILAGDTDAQLVAALWPVIQTYLTTATNDERTRHDNPR